MPLVVHPHFHRRCTGATRHVESVVPALVPLTDTRVIESALTGRVLDATLPRIGWRDVWRISRTRGAIWHAHRNGELFVGLLLRLFGAKLKLVMTRHASHRPSFLTRLLSRRADVLVSLTQAIADTVGMPSRVVAHGVNLSRFCPPADRDASWAMLGVGRKYGIGVVGRIRRAKGQGDFAQALGALTGEFPDWQGVLVGSAVGSADRTWAQALASPSLTLVGEHSDVLPWYQGLTVLVQPSYAEGLSLVFLEGLASGCCVVATRVSDFPKLIEHGRTGFLFEPGDVAELRSILRELMAHPERAQAIGAAAAEEARARLGIEHEAKALNAIYTELAGA